MEQPSLFDAIETEDGLTEKPLKVVKASFDNLIETDWRELFSGFDELYAITYSSGIQFVNKVIDKFKYSEIIFGCEGVISSDMAAIIAMQITSIKELLRTKTSTQLSKRVAEESLKLFVSRDTKSHEKIFVMRSTEGRTRVICGSANMSSSAFGGVQRENIVCFDDEDAFNYYYSLYLNFKDNCSDHIGYDAIVGTIQESDFLQDNIDEVPIVRTIQNKKLVILEEHDPDEVVDLVVNVKGLEHEMKPMMPKLKKDEGRVLLTGDAITGFKRKYKEHRETEKIKRRQLPKLHLDYDTKQVLFNDKIMNMNPESDVVESDIKCLTTYLSSLSSFYGDYSQSQKDYFAFMNWYFASAFMPYLRFVASKNNYDVTPFPVIGIIYGDSNGGKSTFIRLLTKLMCGHRVPMNGSGDFTSTRIEELKRACEGLPINIDDLAKIQFQNHSEKVIKDDDWGIPEGFINYPAIAITTNKLASLPQDITKRTVTCHIDARIDKEAGAKNSRKINESLKLAGTALFCEYAKRMFEQVSVMEQKMKSGEEDYFPDVFEVSSQILVDIISRYCEEVPSYIRCLSYTDYFGDEAVGRVAMQKIMTAWKNEPKQFKIDRKNNRLIYTYPEQGRLYELAYIQQELPPVLNPQLTAKSIVMDLDKAIKVFDTSFRRGIFGW